MKVEVKKLPKSEIEITGEMDAGVFESYYSKALKRLGENVELPGFRKGKVPENILVEKVGEMHILEEMAGLALGEEYPNILEQEKIDAIGRPEINITKLARNNPLGFKIKTAVLPEVKMPDYKKIAGKVLAELKDEDKNPAVTDKDVEDTILDIRKSRAPKVHMADHAHKEGEVHEHPEPELPEFNDEFVKALGPFEGIEDFKAKLRENLILEKKNQAREKIRLNIMEKIIADTKVELPELLITSEVDKILHTMESDIAAMGLKFEDYLKHINKKPEDLRKDFRADGEKRAKLTLVMHEIAKAEKIAADPEQVKREVAMILEHYKDADPERARMHAENVLTNERIFNFLENQ
jgi:FKBP-type peptidyl-prolyl cis-trans isomerase (trigger factor)